MKKFAAHGPMIEDPEHGKYVRFEDVRAELARLDECIKQLTESRHRISRLMKRNQDLVFDIIAVEQRLENNGE